MSNEQNQVTGELTTRLGEHKTLSEALGLTDEDVDNFAGLAAALYEADKMESALKIFEGLVSLRPERGEYWAALGAALTHAERHEEAIPVLSVAIQMDPKDPAALVNRGECYLAMANNEKAAEDFKLAIELDPKEQDPASNRARQLVFGMHDFFDQCRAEGLDEVEIEDD